MGLFTFWRQQEKPAPVLPKQISVSHEIEVQRPPIVTALDDEMLDLIVKFSQPRMTRAQIVKTLSDGLSVYTHYHRYEPVP